MAKNEMLGKIGSWSFLIGILIALIIGFYYAWTLQVYIDEPTVDNAEKIFFTTDEGGMVAWVLAVLGAIVGILAVLGRGTITQKETPGYLLAGIALVVMGGVFAVTSGGGGLIGMTMSLKPWIGPLLSGISFSLSIFVAPTVGILAIKAIWDMGKDV